MQNITLFGGGSRRASAAKPKKTHRLRSFFIVLLSIIVLGEGLYFYLCYTDNAFVSKWRDIYVQTAMTTLSHQWLATDLLPEKVMIVSLGLCWVIFASFLLTMLEPQLSLSEVLFETVSAVATVGLSMDVTPTLGTLSKLIIIVTMYIGRLGPLTIATMWVTPQKGISRPEEEIPIG